MDDFYSNGLEPKRVRWDERAVTHKCKRSWRLEGTGATLDLWVQERVHLCQDSRHVLSCFCVCSLFEFVYNILFCRFSSLFFIVC